MSQDNRFSDEFLNAFVDNQLTPEEKSHAYAQLSDNPVLNRQICELRKVRDLVQLAYKELPMPPKALSTFAVGRKCSLGLAAGLALLVGGIAGWFLHQPSTPRPVAVAQAMQATETPAKVLIHISSGKPEHLKSVLDDVDDLMSYYHRTRQQARVEVVANGEGLGMLLAGVSPYADRIRQMQKKYHGLTFVACQNTIDRYQEQLGMTAKLLPGVVVIDSGVAQIMRRQQEGWAYIQG
jgi:intracellular sulfur oxidation DsrE/DsrF family protein